MIKHISKRSLKCTFWFLASSCSSRDHLPERCLDSALTQPLPCNISCSPSLQRSARAAFHSHVPFSLPSHMYSTGKCDWEMGHLPVQYSWVTHTGVHHLTDQMQRTLSFRFISSFILLNIWTYYIFFTLAAKVWILSVAAGVSSWLCFSVTFLLSELWLMLNRISMLSSSSLLTVSVPQVLCMAGGGKKKEELTIKRILQVQCFPLLLIQIVILLKKPHQNL